MNPQMLQALLSGQLTKDGSGPGGLGAIGSLMGGSGGGPLVPMLLFLAGMGTNFLPRLLNSIMDFQSVGKDDDSQENPGALAPPPDQPPPFGGGEFGGGGAGRAWSAQPPQGPAGMPPPGMMPPGAGPAGGPPPGLVQAMLQMAMQRRMAGGGM